jgi:hypothetical protein
MEKEWKYVLEDSRIVNFEETKLFHDLIKCPICFNILWNPKSCKICKNKFCNFCISDYCQDQYTNIPKCPFRCIYEKTEPDILLKQLLSLVKFFCLNKNLGCSEEINYENIEKHEIICEYGLNKCIYCQSNIKFDKINEHLKSCEEKIKKNIKGYDFIPNRFSDEFKSENIKLENDILLYLPIYNGKFHVAFGDKEMFEGVHKWKIFFKSNNDRAVGLVAGIAEMKGIPNKFSFDRFVDIYQEYNCYACTVWNQIWEGSINDISKSFVYDNKWDNQWWEYELNFEKKLFIIKTPDSSFLEFNIKNGIYRIYLEVSVMMNMFLIKDINDKDY